MAAILLMLQFFNSTLNRFIGVTSQLMSFLQQKHILIQISLKLVSNGLINNKSSLVQIMANKRQQAIFSELGHQSSYINSLRPRLNRRPFADDIFKCIFLNENEWISPRISLKFVPKGPINNNPALVQIMTWRRSDDKPLSEPMMVNLLPHICVTRPQWVKYIVLPSATDAVWTIFNWFCHFTEVCP